jgi:hypothetical protein
MSPQPRKRTQPQTARATKAPKPHAEDRGAAAKPAAPDHPAPADAPPTDTESRFPLQTGTPGWLSTHDDGTSLSPEGGRLSSPLPLAGRIWT